MGLPFKSFEILRNWLIVLNLSNWATQQIQNNESVLEYLEGLKRQLLSQKFLQINSHQIWNLEKFLNQLSQAQIYYNVSSAYLLWILICWISYAITPKWLNSGTIQFKPSFFLVRKILISVFSRKKFEHIFGSFKSIAISQI